ncbi:hypothetical protein TNCV_3817471 [Trichonephila clavipes]|nr:hypothetical protein TNCV_3817471 [Trichonephila clavipes]
MQVICDPCADITIIQQSDVPVDDVIHSWTDGQFPIVGHKTYPIGIQNNTSDEENDSSAEKQDPAEDFQKVFVTTGPSPNQHYLHHNHCLPKRFEQYVS